MNPLSRHLRRQAKLRVLSGHRRAFRNGILIGMAAATAGWWVAFVVRQVLS